MTAENTHAQGENDFSKIPKPALRALNGAGYFSVKHLTQTSKTELSKLHGMGPKVLRIPEQALTEQGLEFGGEVESYDLTR